MKKIILIEADPQLTAQIREGLQNYQLEALAGAEEAIARIEKQIPDLIVYDIDQEAGESLNTFRRLRGIAPAVPIVMLSSSNDIPLAVRATKLGVADFIKKPLVISALIKTVGTLTEEGKKFIPRAEDAWLKGSGQQINQMYRQIDSALAYRNIWLCGEAGIRKEDLVKYLHSRTTKKRSRLELLELNSFRRDNLETHFWMTLQELMAEPDFSQLRSEEDLCGTVFLNQVDAMDDTFLQSLLEFIADRRGKIDREIMVVLGVSRTEAMTRQDFGRIEIPALRDRPDDLPFLVNHYLRIFGQRYNKRISGIALPVIEFFAAYNFPGNYIELEKMVEMAVLLTNSEMIDYRSLPFNFNQLLQMTTGSLVREGETVFSEANRGFEKTLYAILLEKTGGDLSAVARFLDIPRTVFNERVQELGLFQ